MFAALALVAFLQEEPPKHAVPSSLQARINDAIDAGVEALFTKQNLDGSWNTHLDSYGAGGTGLAVYTLLKSEVRPEHPAVVAGLEFIRRHPPKKTYALATCVLALTANGDRKDEELVQSLVDRLLDTQVELGWAYPGGHVDLSNTQFAALALHAAEVTGFDVPQSAWTELAEATVEYTEEIERTRSGDVPQGFRYRHDGGHATGSMTGAGVAILAMCIEHMRGARGPYTKAMNRGKHWFQEHFSVDINPAPGTDSGRHGHLEYYLYGLERIGSLLDLELLGGQPWYRLGAEKIVGMQKGDGAWGGEPATCFCLLFLSRATGKVGTVSGGGKKKRRIDSWTFGDDDPNADVSLRGSGRGQVSMWVSSFSDAARRSYGVGDDAVVPVKLVEYLALEKGKDGDEILLASFEANPEEAERHSRYPVRVDLTGPAEYEVYARLTLVFPEGEEELLSKSMDVRVPMTQRPEWIEYASDYDRNELRDAEMTVTASSHRDGATARPQNVVDGMVGLGWQPTAEDGEPWIRIDLRRPVRGQQVLLSFARPTGNRYASYQLFVNGEDEPLEGEFDADGRLKTIVTFPRRMRVRSLELRFPGAGAGDWAPLGEVEVQNVRR